MKNIRDALTDCSLTDLGYSSKWFTWERGWSNANNIRERLDRGVANEVWGELFQNYKLKHLTHAFSNYCPFLLQLDRDNLGNKQWHFRFESTWLFEESCGAKVLRLWNDSSSIVSCRLTAVGVGLDLWFRRLKRERKFRKCDLENQLAHLNDTYPSDEGGNC